VLLPALRISLPQLICRPPGKCRFLPGKLAVRGLPGAKRRDAKAAGRSALGRELSRRQHAAGGRPGHSSRRGHRKLRDGERTGRWRVRGNGAAAAAHAVRPHAEAAGQAAVPTTARPPRPQRQRHGTSRPSNATPQVHLRPLHEPGQGRTAQRAEGVPLNCTRPSPSSASTGQTVATATRTGA
jgi:hypothetical protein